jgi:pilus assembly protein CpaE
MPNTPQHTRIVIVGSADRQLEEALRPTGAQLSSLPFEDLGTLAQPAGTQPDALVIDLRERPAVPAVLGVLKRHHPRTGVLIVAAALDPTLMLDAMRAGVSEWLAEPFAPSAVAAAVQRVMAGRETPANTGQVHAFIGAKGGVGTTTLAANVLTALRKQTRRSCVLLDLNLSHGDAALFFGVEPKFSVTDAIENSHRLDPALLKSLVVHTKAGVDLLASGERAPVGMTNPQQIRSLIGFIAQHYDYVGLDVPRNDPIMLDALESAAKIVVVANQDLATVRNASRLVLMLKHRYGKDRVVVVMSRYDKSAEIGRDDVERVSGSAVSHLIPSDYRLALDALNKGRPLVVENHSRLAASVNSFTRELAGLTAEKSETQRSSGLLGRFAGRRA